MMLLVYKVENVWSGLSGRCLLTLKLEMSADKIYGGMSMENKVGKKYKG